MQNDDIDHDPEALACQLQPVSLSDFNPQTQLPFGCSISHIHQAMNSFIEFLGFVNQQLYTKQFGRLETMLMPANFSSMVGEFMCASIPKYCSTLVRNRYHNGHPDLIPAATFPNDAIQYAEQGIEIKSSRNLSSWQGHNPENAWLMVFVFDSNRPDDALKGVAPKPFQFVKVVGAQLTMADWKFAGRSESSRRTITASVTPSGYQKMMANWLYINPTAGLPKRKNSVK